MPTGNSGLDILKACLAIDQQFYPERLGELSSVLFMFNVTGMLFFINAPWIFKPVWAIIKPWLGLSFVASSQLITRPRHPCQVPRARQ